MATRDGNIFDRQSIEAAIREKVAAMVGVDPGDIDPREPLQTAKGRCSC